MTWKRDKSQEDGSVLRWYEEGHHVASLVEGSYPNEAEWRIDSPKGGSVIVRGDKKIMLNKTDSQNIALIKSVKRGEKYR